MTYFDNGPGWSMCWKIDIGRSVSISCCLVPSCNYFISSFIPYPINDSIWLANSSLLIGAGHQMLLYGPPKLSGKDLGVETESLFEYVARQNGPLPDYHPQMLLQCLLWGKLFILEYSYTEIIISREDRARQRYNRESCQRFGERSFEKVVGVRTC